MERQGDTAVLSGAEVAPLAVRALLAAGSDSHNAEAVARTVALAELQGSASHGLFRVPGYAASLRSGKVNPHARARVAPLAGAVLRVDGDDGFAPPAHEALVAPLAALAHTQGIAAAALVRMHHFSALWVETEALARLGVVSFACTAYMPMVAPAGGSRPLFGTNPLSFAWPRDGLEPMVFDMASSVMARGEIMLAERAGEQVPLGVGVGPDGEPTTDPSLILRGAQLPFGGYKGSSIALMVELLAASLLGERTSPEAADADNNDGGPPRGGELLVAFSPKLFGAADSWSSSAERFFALLLSQEGTRLPGDGRRARAARVATEGVRVPIALYDKIVAGFAD